MAQPVPTLYITVNYYEALPVYDDLIRARLSWQPNFFLNEIKSLAASFVVASVGVPVIYRYRFTGKWKSIYR
jgi:hypothetical protein